jgi:hypothetical protein
MKFPDIPFQLVSLFFFDLLSLFQFHSNTKRHFSFDSIEYSKLQLSGKNKLFKLSEGRRKKEQRKASFCVKNFRKMREKVKEKFEEFC